ncbi:MAG: cell division protein FtsA [Kiritimatiellae bacterium]|nr:cell division protein FtsA [Kiritimatiellia bacterium]
METCVIIEVGTSFTRGMVIEPFENGTYKILAIAEDKTAGVKKGEIINIQNAGTSVMSVIKQLSEEADTTIRTVNLIYSGGYPQYDLISGTKTIKKGEVIEADHIATAEENAMENELPEGRMLTEVITVDYLLDNEHFVENPIGMVANSLTVNRMRLHVDQNRISSILNILNDNSIDYQNIYFSGLVSALGATTQQQRKEGVLVINLGGGCTTWSLYINRIPRHVGGIPIGGDHITNDILYAFKTTNENAEILKRTHGSATIEPARALKFKQDFTEKIISQNDLSKVINARIDETIRIIYDQIAKAGLLETINTIMLCGKGAALNNLETLVYNIFQTQCFIANPKIPFHRIRKDAPTMAYVALLGAAHCCTKEAIQEEARKKNSSGFFGKLFGRGSNI